MDSLKLKPTSRMVPVLMLGISLFLTGCSVNRLPEGSRKITKMPDGMLHGTLDLSSGSHSGGSVFVEKIMPSKVTVGKPFECTLRVTNRTDCDLSDVIASERFPEKYEMVKASPVPAKVSGRVTEWTLGELGPKETKSITISGTAQEISPMIACTKVTYTPMLCLGPETTASGLKLTIEAPNQAVLCDGIAEKIVITNTGAESMKGIKISQTLPEGLTTAEGKSSLEIPAGDFAGRETKSFDVKLKAQKNGSYAHKVRAMALDGLSVSSASVTTVVKEPVLKITLSGPDKVFMTRDADFKITVENTGNADSANTTVTAKIPAGMKFVSASNGGSVSGDSVVWNLGVLAVQKSVSLSVAFKSVASGPVQGIVVAKGACCREASATAKTDVQGIPAILLEAVDTEDPIQVGGMEKFRVIVTNQGSAPDTHIVLKIDLENNFDYISSSGPTQAKAESAKAIEFAPLASLAPGQKATWEITAKATEEGDHRASFHVRSDSISRSVEKIESTRVY